MTIKAVIFDIGNVLIEWQPEKFYDAHIGPERRRALFSQVDLHQMNNLIDLGHPWRETIVATAQKHPQWASEIMMWHTHWIDIAQPVFWHSLRCLRALRRKGICVYALSNLGTQTFEYAKTYYPFLAEFDRHYISGYMKMVKPDMDIYRTVEADCGLLGAQLLFTDDRDDNIRTARQCGWNTHHFQTPHGFAQRLIDEGLLTADEAC